MLRTLERFEASEALAALVVLGVMFPALAMLATRQVSALPYVVRRPGFQEMVKSEQANQLVEKADSTYMHPTDFSPMK